VIARLTRRIRRLARLAEDVQNLAVDLESELAVLQRVLRADATGRLDAAIEYAAARGREAQLREQLRTSAVGASKLETRAGTNGAVMVRIDDGQWFRLSRADARILALLIRQPLAADGFPGWMSYDELGEQIAQKTGSLPTRRAVIESVYRVRKALKEVDLNQYLLRVDPKPGRLRFLLRTVLPADGGAHRRRDRAPEHQRNERPRAAEAEPRAE
jgi:hypothetical protein